MDTSVTQEEALHAFKTLGKLLQEVYEVPRERLLTEVSVYVPTSVFRAGLPPFTALATYLHQQGIDEKRIAKMLKRNRTFVRASITDQKIESEGRQLPVTIFAADLSILEAAAYHLASQGLDNPEIAEELGKSVSAVWTLRKRAEEKIGGGRA